MAQYQTLASLRAQLTSSDADDRVDAYMAVREAGLDVDDDVLVSNPDERTVDALREAGVLPDASESKSLPEGGEQRQRQVELLERIAEAVEGGNV